jgi:hypothetical protein
MLYSQKIWRFLGQSNFRKTKKKPISKVIVGVASGRPLGLTATRLFSFVCVGIQKALVQ